jgi:tetratricopeptide (TPR) repeat protein
MRDGLRISLIVLSAVMLTAKFSPAQTPQSPDLSQTASAAIAANNLGNLRQAAEAQAKPLLANPQAVDADSVARIGSYRELALYFGQLGQLKPDQQELLQWLISQNRLMPTLMAAVGKKDQPAKVLSLLSALRAQQGTKLNDYADLTTAFLVVWDKPPADLPGGVGATGTAAATLADPQRVSRLFNYFLNSGNLRFSPHDLPWQLSLYLVDVRLSEDEMLWATQRYGSRNDIGSIYFEVPYDDDYLNKATDKKITGHDYTLANILQYGGICVDQAYYASQIAKIRGIPACICTGESGAGNFSHAWTGFLTQSGQTFAWDFDEARYKEDLFWEADIDSPQTHEPLTDAEVGLLAQLPNFSPADRLASSLLAKMTDLSPDHRAELLMRAVDLSPGNRGAWLALANLAANGKLSGAQMDQVGQAVQKYLGKPYPDFAYEMLVKMSAGAPADQQLAALSRIGAMFPDRPDLQARIAIRQGDLLHAAGKDDDAIAAYGQALTSDLDAGPVILSALKKVDKILRDRNDLARLLGVYDQVWHRMPVPPVSGHVTELPYFIVGQQYANLLDGAGKSQDAAGVRAQLQSLSTVQIQTP